MNPDVDKEIEAIKVILGALQPLSPEIRLAVMEYVHKRLGMTALASQDAYVSPPTPLNEKQQLSSTTEKPPTLHIKTLKEQKQPKSAIEMAVLVAYYLSHVVPEDERKETISAKDLDTYFRIAEFKLPAQQKFNLQNAKNAGYLDSAASGEYKLNPVGYNLIVHSMPHAGKSSGKKTGKKAAKKAGKKAAKKAGKKAAKKAGTRVAKKVAKKADANTTAIAANDSQKPT
jgi:hypothetical protein